MIQKRHSLKTAIASLILLAATSFSSLESLAQDGEKLFKQNCATCHRVDGKKMTGPGLEGFWDRLPEPKEETYVSWVQNPPAVLKGGGDAGAYFNALVGEFNGVVMTAQGHLSKEDILAIGEYVKAPGGEEPAAGAAVQDCSWVDTYGVEEEDNTDTTRLIWLLILGVIFVVLLIALTGLKRSLKNLKNERDGLPQEEDLTNWEAVKLWMGNNKRYVALIIILMALGGAKDGWYALKGVGVNQNYAPVQPIKFSHKIHAGDKKINCVYCHSSAEQGKTAGIPSVNVCMNCHKGISSGTCTGEEEIAKIYEAAGWDPEKGQYTGEEKPVEWIRIHQLPDFAYFNHSQHVVVGKQKCQTCHGPVEEMHLLEQYSDLSMGWCVNCHRETAVAMDGNPYYEKLHEQLKEKYKDTDHKVFTVEDIGGLECAKCHY